LQVKENFSLKKYNTFGIDVSTRYFIELTTDSEIENFIKENPYKTLPILILGGGSNILFTKNFDGIILKIETKGIEIIRENDESIFVKAKAGELWNDLVNFCVEKNFGGIENLALIPGCVGASPIQNIGAYGSEMKDTFFELEAIDILHGQRKIFSQQECRLAYRNSIFKNELKGKYIILSVTFKLQKNPILNISYSALSKELQKLNLEKPTVAAVRDTVCKIRESKLPDPKIIGNAGSFFKNPSVTVDKYNELKNKFPEIVAYPAEDGNYKLAAGWMIDQCGWKGKRKENAGVHEKQALVMVNLGNASGNEILDLAHEVKVSVKNMFDVDIEFEVNII